MWDLTSTYLAPQFWFPNTPPHILGVFIYNLRYFYFEEVPFDFQWSLFISVEFVYFEVAPFSFLNGAYSLWNVHRNKTTTNSVYIIIFILH